MCCETNKKKYSLKLEFIVILPKGPIKLKTYSFFFGMLVVNSILVNVKNEKYFGKISTKNLLKTYLLSIQ
jgi:hypothetical protein